MNLWLLSLSIQMVVMVILGSFVTAHPEYKYPWLQTAEGSSPIVPDTAFINISAVLTKAAESEEVVLKGPRLVSPRYTHFVLSRGSAVTLNCTVEEAGDVGVSWVHGEEEVLAVGRYRYTGDERVAVLHEVGSSDYSLRVSPLQLEDSGIYECQVESEPRQVARVKVDVIDAYSVIFGSSEIRVVAGGTLYLLCLVLQVYDIPDYILWYHNSSIIDYARPSVTVTTEEETRSSELQVHNISFTDAGNYTCHPSNASPSYVIVNVTNDTNKKTGKTEKCDDCVLFIQLGATFAFFTLSFLVAFCFHSHKKNEEVTPAQDDYEEYYYSDSKML